VDQDETNGGKSNRVSFRLQAWRFIIAAPLIKGRTLPQIPGGSFLASIGGSLLKSAEDIKCPTSSLISRKPFLYGVSSRIAWVALD
jgi:hypothetical protein